MYLHIKYMTSKKYNRQIEFEKMWNKANLYNPTPNMIYLTSSFYIVALIHFFPSI